MKRKIAAIDWDLDNPDAEKRSLLDDKTLDEYDVLIINPIWIDVLIELFRKILVQGDINTYYLDIDHWNFAGKKINSMINDKKAEFRNIIRKNSGIIIFKLLPNDLKLELQYEYDKKITINRYSFIPRIYFDSKGNMSVRRLTDGSKFTDDIFSEIFEIRQKNGSFYEYDKKSPVSGFFETLEADIDYKAVMDGYKNLMANFNKIATNRAGDIISLDFNIDSGRIILLPDFKRNNPKKEAAILLDVIYNIFESTVFEKLPEWATKEKYKLPKVDLLDKEIVLMKRRIEEKQQELKKIEKEKESLERYNALLWGTGRMVLEPIVREAFRFIGFKVPDPKEYAEEYDAILYSPEGDAIAEIEGSVEMINVKKFRQLLDYIENEYDKGKKFKGIVVGNGYRLEDSEKRSKQFSDQVIERCKSKEYCVLSTLELFKIVKLIMGNIDNEKLKKGIRKNILETAGEFKLT